MEYEELRKKLKKYGYTRKTARLSELSNGTVCRRNFSDKSLNHTRLLNSTVTGTNFYNAALTGSYFQNCEFRNCNMNMSDFEYCEFYRCCFKSKKDIIGSFNESNFIETEFYDITFSSCSFSGAFFENCKFVNTKMEFTTFENALFRNCEFKDINMSVLNLDYVEFENPRMDNVILPMEQIPHSIGILEYSINTADAIRVGSDSNVELSIEEYWNEVIPLLKEEYHYTKEYFPLANIYLAQKEYEKAIQVLHYGLENAVSNRDFRMLKFYCKLIKTANCFESHILHNFYHSICRLSPNPYRSENSSLLRGYIRNIGEIKNILFDSTKKPTLHMALLTNLSAKQNEHTGKLISWLFNITKMGEFPMPNKASLKITENSPLLIDIDIIGEEENIALLFPVLLSLSDSKCELPLLNMDRLSKDTIQYSRLTEHANQCHSSCNQLGISLVIFEYYFENCNEILSPDQNIYYYNSNLKQYSRSICGI